MASRTEKILGHFSFILFLYVIFVHRKRCSDTRKADPLMLKVEIKGKIGRYSKNRNSPQE